MSWLHDKTTTFLSRIDEAKRLKAFPFFRPFENLGPRVKIGNGSYVNFTSNDYLGLSQHPRLIEAACAGTRRFGTGLGSARPQATSVRHDLLESRLARWTGKQACAVFTTGYQSIVGTLSAFLDDETTVVLDKLSHASIIDGVLLAQGMSPNLEIRWFTHNKPDSLDKVLATAAHPKKLVVVEGLYSVDGDLAPLADFVTVCKKHDAAIMVDDAHGLGAVGATGRGVGELFGVMDEIDLLIGTFSKSFGTVGGFVCADQPLIDYMKLNARAFVFSASLPLAQVEAGLAALDVIEHDSSYRERLERNRQFFRGGLCELGADLGDSTTHITPILVRDEVKCLTAAAMLFHGAGVIMMPFVYPGVAKGTERLRCNVTAAHTEAQMGYTLEALAKVGAMAGFLPERARTFNSPLRRASWLVRHKLEGALNAGLPFVRKELAGAVASSMVWKDLDFVASELLPIKLALWKVLYLNKGQFSIVELWDRSVKRNPDNAFVKGEGFEYSYAEFDRLANGIAAELRELGLQSKDKVAVVGESVPNCVAHLIACLKLGVAPVVMRPSSTEAQFHSFLSGHGEIKFLFGTEAGLTKIPPAIQAKLGRARPYPKLPQPAASSTPLPSLNVRFSDVAFHVGTSGSSGNSKSVAVHHGALLAFVNVHKSMKSIRPDDVVYGMASLSHGDGLAIGVVTPWTVGASLFLDEEFAFETFVEKCVKHGVTIFNHIGTTPRKLLRQPKSKLEASLKLRVSNGHEMIGTVWDAFKQRFGVEDVVEYYCSSEGLALFLNRTKVGAAGFMGPISKSLYPFAIVKLDERGNLLLEGGKPVRCKPGEVGELLGFADPSDPLTQMNSYEDKDIEDAKMVRSLFEPDDCWFRSGDLLRHDADGYIHFVGREVQTVRIRGDYVSFPHVEDEALATWGELEDCCVAAVATVNGPELALLVRPSDAAKLDAGELFASPLGQRFGYIVLADEPFKYTESFRIVRTLPNPMPPEDLARCGQVFVRAEPSATGTSSRPAG